MDDSKSKSISFESRVNGPNVEVLWVWGADKLTNLSRLLNELG